MGRGVIVVYRQKKGKGHQLMELIESHVLVLRTQKLGYGQKSDYYEATIFFSPGNFEPELRTSNFLVTAVSPVSGTLRRKQQFLNNLIHLIFFQPETSNQELRTLNFKL